MRDALYHVRTHLEDSIKKEFPDFEYVDKRYSKFMKFLAQLLFFNKSFMSSYITVVGNKVYVPKLPWKKTNPYGAIEVLSHEWVHMKDNKRLGIWFKLLYLFPQILAPLALLGFWNPWFLLFLLCILPYPAPNYYYMYPFEDYMRERLEEEFYRIEGDILEPHEQHIKNVLLRRD